MIHFLLGFMLLTLTSCVEREPFKRVFTETEKEYFKTLPLEQKVYMEGCLTTEYMTTALCISQMRKMYMPVVVSPSGESTSSSIIKTAVGTAIGYGAVKLITGKRK